MSRTRFVVPVMAGIGNAVMTVPMVQRLAEAGDVTVEAGSAAIGDVFGRLPGVEVFVLLKKMGEKLGVHRAIEGDVYVVPFPSNRWQYTLLAATTVCSRVVMHDYPVGRWRTGRAMLRSATLLPAVRGLHDVEQNLKLADAAVGADSSMHRTPVFPLHEHEKQAAESLDLPQRFAAVQAGCGDTIVGRVKRLPDATWVDVIDRLADDGLPSVLVEGPDERGVGERIARLCRSSPRVLPLVGSLGDAAAVLERAAVFVGTDSGLAHVAAAVGTPAVTAFAAADPDRVCPHGYRDLVVTPPPVDGRDWTPRLLYPMDAAGPKLRPDDVEWATHLRPDDLIAAVHRVTHR